jgi:hypothetical protein
LHGLAAIHDHYGHTMSSQLVGAEQASRAVTDHDHGQTRARGLAWRRPAELLGRQRAEAED